MFSHISSYPLPLLLDGGAVVHDLTDKVAKAQFIPDLSIRFKQAAYQIFIGLEQLVKANTRLPVIFTSSKIISFIPVESFIEVSDVTEIAERVYKTTFYVDPKRALEGGIFEAFTYMPREMTLEEVQLKLDILKESFSGFEADMIVYNRHGVAAYGYDKQLKEDVLFWANPHQEKVSKISCSECRRDENNNTYARAQDGRICFKYNLEEGFSLNSEKALRFL